MLIEAAGLRILTDPVLRGRIGHLRRLVPPPAPAAVAEIDVALVSHAHHDHLDVPSLRSLTGSPHALCPPPALRPVRRAGLSATALRRGETWSRGDVEIAATAADHDARRWPLSRDGEAIGFVVRSPAGSVYFAGDTGEFEGMGEIGPVDVALLPVAGWGPKLGPGHLDAAAAARAAAALAPRVAIPIHWGTYAPLHAKQQPGSGEDAPREFAARVAEVSPETRVEVLRPGESTLV